MKAIMRALSETLTDRQWCSGELFNWSGVEVTEKGVVEELIGKVDSDVRVLRLSELEFAFHVLI